jgi:hypothetical protein
MARATRVAEKKLNRFRDDCFTYELKDGTDLECSATNAPPGIVQTTRLAKLDQRLSSVVLALRKKAYDSCEVDLGTLGFPQSIGGHMPDYTGNSFSAEDLFTVVADAL